MKLFRFGSSFKSAKLEQLGNPWKSRPRISKCQSENRLGEDADDRGRLDVGSNLGLNGHDLSLTNYVERLQVCCCVQLCPFRMDRTHIFNRPEAALDLLPERDDEAATPRKPESTALARLRSSLRTSPPSR